MFLRGGQVGEGGFQGRDLLASKGPGVQVDGGLAGSQAEADLEEVEEE